MPHIYFDLRLFSVMEFILPKDLGAAKFSWRYRKFASGQFAVKMQDTIGQGSM